MQIKSWSFFGVTILSLLLILSGFFLWQLYQFEIGSTDDVKKYSMFLNQYKITRLPLWSNTFESESKNRLNVAFE